MKILHLADLHAQRDWFDWVASEAPNYDLLVIAGDLQDAFSRASMKDQAEAIGRWLLALRAPVVVASGNHDYSASDPRKKFDATAEGRWLRVLRDQGTVIGVDGDVIEHGGLRILVNGWLQVPELARTVDIVVSHAPPSGCECAYGAEGRDVGDMNLWPALQDHPPSLILCGHVHQPAKLACTWPRGNSRTHVLVPGCDEREDIPAHWLINTARRTATHSSGEQVTL